MKKLSIVLAAFLFVPGCNSVERLQRQWLGRDQSVLIAVKGSPDKVTSDEFGGQIYTYLTSRPSVGLYYSYGGPAYFYPGHSYWRRPYGHYYGRGEGVTGKTMFWIDPIGKIYKVSVSY